LLEDVVEPLGRYAQLGESFCGGTELLPTREKVRRWDGDTFLLKNQFPVKRQVRPAAYRVSDWMPGADQPYPTASFTVSLSVTVLPVPPLFVGTISAGGWHGFGESPTDFVEDFLLNDKNGSQMGCKITDQSFVFLPSGYVEYDGQVVAVDPQAGFAVHPLGDSLRHTIDRAGGVTVSVIHRLTEVKSVENDYKGRADLSVNF
jgi:hypothetical protein